VKQSRPDVEGDMENDQVSAEEWNERVAFQIYLRTGKILPVGRRGELQVKFNPWHDPEDGRFTFAGQGTYFGGRRQAEDTRQSSSPQKRQSNAPPTPGNKRPVTFGPAGGTGGRAGASGARPRPTVKPSQNSKPRGGDFAGGGSFGGGGAGESWSEAAAPPQPKKAERSRQSIPAGQSAPPRRRVGVSVRKPTITVASSRRIIQKNGYSFEVNAETGAHRRTEHVFGELQSEPKERRSKREQLQAGGVHRGKTDDGGHFIAPRFNGPRDWFNHFAQNSNINRGAYRVIEDGWAKERDAGKRVFVDIVASYPENSTRAESLTIRWTVDEEERVEILPNPRKGD
jgi:hypothetical protein